VEWSEELSGGLLQAAPDAILVMDQGRVVLVNDRAEQMFGWPRAELLGRDAEEVLLTDAGRNEYPRRIRRSSAGPQPGPMGTISIHARRRDGSEFPVEASLAAVDTPEGRVVVAVVRDCTDLHRSEVERTRLRREAQAHRNERLESLGKLAGGIAHDFNNMLGVIVNYATFVIEEATSAEPDVQAIAADARQVVRAGERATDLTHQLLAFARREVVRPRPVDLNAVLGGVEETLRRAVGDRVTLVVRPGADLPSVVWDPGQIEQLLVNLTANARDAMPDAGTLVIDTAAHRFTHGDDEHAPGDYVRLRVSDSGRGMPADVAERAFEPFFTTKASGEGTGLGLATVYGIVTQAGGTVHLSSEPGLGTTVTVLIPAGDGPPVAPEPAEPASTSANGETLLVVDDEDALREVAGRILAGAGYHVLAADGGRSALELAALHEGAIDLLVSDVMMPGMLGKELAERLVDARPETRVLYMSGYARPVLASQGTLEDGVALLEKPFSAEDLLSAVRKRLDG
jgi:PAS domain S-box-containing protein